MEIEASFGDEQYLQNSAMVRLASQFDDLATGRTQIPKQKVESRIQEKILDSEVLNLHDLIVSQAGPLFCHFLASVPCILEEMSRIGVALSRLAQSRLEKEYQTFSFYELDAFDGSNGRALAKYSKGMIRTFTSSPNRANEQYFNLYADHGISKFHPESFLRIDHEFLIQNGAFSEFSEGFDYVYETAAFQFYGQDRDQQIGHVAKLLKVDGLFFFLEKLNHVDPIIYEAREKTKDELHKRHYFTDEEISWKRSQMLSQMHNGQVDFETLLLSIRMHFSHVYLLWNSTNFYEFVASNDPVHIETFISIIGPQVIPIEFCFESLLPLKLT